MTLQWDTTKRRYRDSATGRLLSRGQLRQLRDELADAYSGRFRELTRQYGEGTISQTAWERGFRALIVEASSAGYAFGRGGLSHLTDADFDTLLGTVTTQLDFGDAFFADVRSQIDRDREARLVRDIKAALLPQITARADLYGGAVIHGFEQGHAAAVSEGALRNLPAYPADGGTECRANCRCAWHIVERDGMWVCTWQTEQDGAVCTGCQARGAAYHPLLVAMGSPV